MRATDDAATLGELVVANPDASALFEQLGLDYCCGGSLTLADACARRGLDAATVAVMVDGLARARGADGPDPHDVSRATIGELCDHILLSHHGPLPGELARIAKLMDTVVRVHGESRPQLVDLARVFATLRGELEAHVLHEERSLFPACRRLEEHDDPAAFDSALLAELEDEHGATGDALSALSELADGYRTDRALCATHRRLLESLHAFELELHQHIHEENNVLFGKVRRRLAAAL